MSEPPVINPADHIGLVYRCARKFADYGEPAEDSQPFSDACIALCQAAKCFDSSRGIKFSTYATAAICIHMSCQYRRRKEKSKRLSVTNGVDETLEHVPEFDERFGQTENVDTIEFLLDHLGDTGRRIIVAHWLDNVPFADIAKREQVSIQDAKRIASRALRTMRQVVKQTPNLVWSK